MLSYEEKVNSYKGVNGTREDELLDWTNIYNGAITSVSNINIEEYDFLRMTLLEKTTGKAFIGYSYFDVNNMAKFIRIGTFKNTTHFVSLEFDVTNNKMTYSSIGSAAANWTNTSYNILIQGATE